MDKIKKVEIKNTLKKMREMIKYKRNRNLCLTHEIVEGNEKKNKKFVKINSRKHELFCINMFTVRFKNTLVCIKFY